jgi:hypothetical protein
MDEQVKDTTDLVNEGGKFYEMDGMPCCDTPLDTYRLVLGKGWVKWEGSEDELALRCRLTGEQLDALGPSDPPEWYEQDEKPF